MIYNPVQRRFIVTPWCYMGHAITLQRKDVQIKNCEHISSHSATFNHVVACNDATEASTRRLLQTTVPLLQKGLWKGLALLLQTWLKLVCIRCTWHAMRNIIPQWPKQCGGFRHPRSRRFYDNKLFELLLAGACSFDMTVFFQCRRSRYDYFSNRNGHSSSQKKQTDYNEFTDL